MVALSRESVLKIPFSLSKYSDPKRVILGGFEKDQKFFTFSLFSGAQSGSEFSVSTEKISNIHLFNMIF